MSVADEIKAKLDIVAYVQQYVPLKKAGRNWKACCPFHAESTPSFMVSEDRQSWRCYGACAVGGDVISFAMKHHGWSFGEALQELGKLAGVEVRQQTPQQKAEYERLDGLRGLLNAAADAYHEALFRQDDPGAVSALAYAREKRSLSDDTLRKFGLGYAMPGWTHMLDYLRQLGYAEEQIVEVGLAVRNDAGRVYDRFRSRLMIPIRDERGRVTGFGARALDPNDNPKYLNSPQTALFDKSKTLFGLDVGKRAIGDSGAAVIVEGYMDAIQAHQAGFGNVVAQMGTALTETQLKLIAPRYAKKIILALDSDAAGQNATLRSLEVARQTLQADYTGRLSVDMRVLHIPDAKDPDDLIRESPERWAELVENATPVAEYVIETETAALPPHASVQEREAAARRLLPILLASESNLYKKDNLQKLALRLRITERDLLAWADEQERLNRVKPPRKSPPPVNVVTLDAPPEFPPLDYGEPPPDEQPAPAAPPRPASREAAMEEYCLRVLLQRPEAYYAVNRTLRRLAGSNRALLDGPLCDWGVDDFSHGDFRALMDIFQRSLEQDEMESLEFVRFQAEDLLQSALERLLTDDLDEVRARLRNGLPADLNHAWNHNRRWSMAIDLNAEVVEKALRLRVRRLQREREELCFLQMDTQGEPEMESRLMQQIMLSGVAKGLIEAELQKHVNMVRE